MLQTCLLQQRTRNTSGNIKNTLLLFNQTSTAPASPQTNCLQSHPSVSGAADGLFSPKAAPYDEELVGCASGAHPMGAPLLRWAGLALGRSSGGGGAQGVAPIPSLPLRLSLGGSSLGRAVSDC